MGELEERVNCTARSMSMEMDIPRRKTRACRRPYEGPARPGGITNARRPFGRRHRAGPRSSACGASAVDGGESFAATKNCVLAASEERKISGCLIINAAS